MKGFPWKHTHDTAFDAPRVRVIEGTSLQSDLTPELFSHRARSVTRVESPVADLAAEPVRAPAWVTES